MFQYIIKMYDLNEEITQIKGIVIGTDFVDAVEHLVATYDKDLESIELLIPIGDGICYELSDDGMKEMDRVREDWIW